MKTEQFPDVLKLHVEGLRYELKTLAGVFPGKSVDESGIEPLRQLLEQILKTGEGRIFVALNKETPIGYCLVTKKLYPAELPKLCGCINGIYVQDPFKRKGVGKMLFDAAVSWLKKGGVTYLELYHMINDERATAFWKKMGFTPIQTNCAKKI